MIVIASDPSISFPKAAGKKEADERSLYPGNRGQGLSPPNPRCPVWSVPVSDPGSAGEYLLVGGHPGPPRHYRARQHRGKGEPKTQQGASPQHVCGHLHTQGGGSIGYSTFLPAMGRRSCGSSAATAGRS